MTSQIRLARDTDADGFIRLIGDAWNEYPNCVLDVDGENPELRHLASYFRQIGGELWTATDGDVIVGMIGAKPAGHDNAWEISRVYVQQDKRGSGLAHSLLDLAEEFARVQGAARLVLWTDTRFDAAHAFYEKRGYVRSGSIRILDDASKSLEFRYAKPLEDMTVEVLDAAAASSAERRLAAIARATNEAPDTDWAGGLTVDATQSYWRGVSSDVATGRCLLLAAWLGGQIMGSAHLRLMSAPHERHRARFEAFMVHPQARRGALGTCLIQRAGQTVRGIGRQLVHAEVAEGTTQESLLLAEGWQPGGRVPGYFRMASGPRTLSLLWNSPATSVAA